MPSPLPRTRALDRPRVKSTVVVLFLVLAAVIVSTVGTARADPGGASIVYRHDIARPAIDGKITVGTSH